MLAVWRSEGARRVLVAKFDATTRDPRLKLKSGPFKPSPLEVDPVDFTLRICSVNREAYLVDMTLD
jgi:hypothetical protein